MNLKSIIKKLKPAEEKPSTSDEFWKGYDAVWKSGPPTRLSNPDNIIDPT